MATGLGSTGLWSGLTGFQSGGGGGTVTDLSATISSTATGAVYALSTNALVGTPTWTKKSGNANLTVVSGSISVASGISDGTSQSIIVRGVVGNDAVEFQVTLTGQGVVASPSLDFSVASNSMYLGAVL